VDQSENGNSAVCFDRRIGIILCAVLFTSVVSAAQYSITVHDYPTGDGPANVVSNGIPFKPGELTNAQNVRVLDGATQLSIATRVLARWHTDNSIRSLLIQFDAPFTGTTKTFTLDVGTARTAPDRALLNVTWRYPRKIATLPAAYLCSSLVCWEQKPLGQSGFPAWDQKQRDNFNRINTEPDPTITGSRTDQYYDSSNSSYQIYVRTGELQYLTNARRWSYHHRRDQIYLSGPNAGHPIISGAYFNNTRYTFVDSLVRDYMFWGDDESLRAAGIVCDYFYMPHDSLWYYKAPNTRGFWTEREAAFAQLGLVAYFEATGNTAYLDQARTRFHTLHQMQVDNGNRAWIHNLYDHDPSEGCPPTAWGSSPFMSGLLMESLIRYHKLTNDPVARESILYTVDYLRAHDVATGSNAGRGFIYLGDPNTYQDANPDIDNLITHAYGYAYRLSNFTRTDYLNFGRDVFNTSVADSYVGAPKQYNQAFRSSGHFVAYIDSNVPGLPQGGNVAPTITTQPVNRTVTAGQTATFSVVAGGTATLAYQWQRNGVNITGAGSASYTTPATVLADSGASFRCVVSNSAGSATSSSATLTVNAAPVAPTITTQPVNRTVTAGQTATFNVVASGTGTLAYQWQRNGVNITGAGSASYTTPATVLADSGATFRCVVSNSAGSATSSSATLTVVAINQAPVAQSQTVITRKNTAIAIRLTATDPEGRTLTYSIVTQPGRGSLSGTAPNVTYTPAPRFSGADSFTFRASDGTLNSNTATVTINVMRNAPTLSSTASALPNPANVGQAVTFSIAASDADGDALSYSWRFGDGANGTDSGAQHAYVTAGQYTAVITVTDEDGLSIESSTSVTVNGGNGGGGVRPPGRDSDGDGVWDENEIADGSNPDDAASFITTPLILKSLSGGVSFKSSSRDWCGFSGVLPGTFSGSFEGASLVLDVSGAKVQFVLNGKGFAKNEFGTAALKLPRTRSGANGALSGLGFSVKIRNGSWAALWRDDGIENTTVKNSPAIIPIDLIFRGRIYTADAEIYYSARQDSSGKFKLQ
jgi:hypothetical protein